MTASPNPILNTQNCMVIDLTYRCNATCHYCQWGSHKTPGRVDQPEEHIYIPKETLIALETQRIVFSGGEPLLRKDVEDIVSYYREAGMQSIIVITNGLLLNEKRLKALLAAGLTGIAFSIDSLNASVSKTARDYSPVQMQKIMDNVTNALSQRTSTPLEVGFNVVLSTANLKKENFIELAVFANAHDLDWVKFNPMFDDGFVGAHAPHLVPGKADADSVKKLGKEFTAVCKVPTNPPGFWESVAALLSGKELDGSSCGLDTRQAIAIRGQIKFCFWIDYPSYGGFNQNLTRSKVAEVREKFAGEKAKCKTGMYCYCLQRMNHKWKMKDEPDHT